MMTPTRRAVASDCLARSQRQQGRTALLGLTLFLVSIGTFAPESAPDPGTATAAAVRRYATANATTLQVNTLAGLLSVGLLLCFVASLTQQIRAADPDSPGPPVMIALAAVVAAEVTFLIGVSSIFGRPQQLRGLSGGAVVTLYELTTTAEWLYTLTVVGPCMLLIATYSYYGLRNDLIARWVSMTGFAAAFIGALAAITLAVPTIAVDFFLIPLFGWWLWPLAVGAASGARWFKERQRRESARMA